MTLAHDEANARLLELVYDEASPAERQALEAHVATCGQCQAELAALTATRAQLRGGLDAGPVPARAHARILEAAAELATARIADPSPQPQPSPRRRGEGARGESSPREASFWERIRGKWTLPTFAVVGAVALMLIGSKVLLDPQRAAEKRREMFPPTETGPAAEPSKLAPAPSDQPATPAAAPPGSDDKTREDGVHGGRVMSPAAQAALERARNFGAGHGSGLLGLSPAVRLGGARLQGSAASRGIATARPLGSASGGGAAVDHLATGAPAKPEPQAEAKQAKRESSKVSAKSAVADSEYAPPPSDWKGGAAAPVARAAPAPAAATAGKRDLDESASLGRVGSAERRKEAAEQAAQDDRAAPHAALAKKKSVSAPPEEEAADGIAADRGAPSPAAASAPEAEQAPARAPAKDAAPPFAALAQRADALYAAQRWTAAIAAYRDLVRRWPAAAPTARWRARLAQAQAASIHSAAPAEQ